MKTSDEYIEIEGADHPLLGINRVKQIEFEAKSRGFTVESINDGGWLVRRVYIKITGAGAHDFGMALSTAMKIPVRRT